MTPSRTLNHDVLVLILSSLDNRADVMRLMRTERALYEIGWPKLLSFPLLITPYNFNDIEKALFTKTTNRCIYLRYILLDNFSRVDLFPSHLHEILRHATELQQLDIAHGQRTFALYPRVADAVADLKFLRNLTIGSPGKPSFALLNRLTCPLVVLDLSNREDLSLGARQELIHLIHNFTNTLEVIRVTHVQIDDLDFVCPHVRLLYLMGLPSEFISTWELVRAFPNLRKLGLHGTARILEEHWWDYRELNEEEPPESPWPYLDIAEGQVEYIWMLALRCPIRMLDAIWYGEGDEYELFDSLDTTHTPSAMVLRIYGDDYDQLEWLKLHASGPPSWTELRLEIDLGGCGGDFRICEGQVSKALEALSLHYVEIEFTGPPLDEESEMWLNFDAETYVKDLSYNMPTLQQAYVLSGWSGESLWRTHGPGIVERLPIAQRPITFTTDRLAS